MRGDSDSIENGEALPAGGEMRDVRGGSGGASSTRMERRRVGRGVWVTTASLSSSPAVTNGRAIGEASERTSFRTDARGGDCRDTGVLPILLPIAVSTVTSSNAFSSFNAFNAFASSAARSTWRYRSRKGCWRSCASDGRMCGSFACYASETDNHAHHCCTKLSTAARSGQGRWGTAGSAPGEEELPVAAAAPAEGEGASGGEEKCEPEGPHITGFGAGLAGEALGVR